MPLRPGPTARSFSRSSKRSEPPALIGGRATIAVGVVAGAHALRGMLRVRPYHLPAPSLAPGRTVLLERNGVVTETRIVSAAPHGRALVLLAVESVTDRTAAEAAAGARVLVLQADLPPAAEDEFYYHELEGFAVETTDGEALGTIEETFGTGTNDVWVVRGGRREHLIPVIADVVRAIDRETRRVVIEPLPGLLE
jgi:16S rRNA processing protein RimM